MDYAAKIAALLKKAESTTPEEAELLIAKAQELMSTYAIDEAMLAHARGQKTERIVEEKIEYHSTYSRAQFHIGAAIARNNGCNVMVSKGKDLMRTTLWVIGFERDVERVRLLNSSLLIQSTAAMNEWWMRREDVPSNQRERFKLRREFLFSFADGLSRKLRLAREHGRTVATKMEANRSNVEYASAADSVELVLADKRTRLKHWMNEQYGEGAIKMARAARFARGDFDASINGRVAGEHADTTTPKPRTQVGRGAPKRLSA
jgi:hypothetical protein